MSAELSFEAAMAKLEEIAALLENGRCTLDESMKLFEEGTRLASFCANTLQTAEQKILRLNNAAPPEATPASAAPLATAAVPTPSAPAEIVPDATGQPDNDEYELFQ
ncbi:MAG: exodeoxyribonuclease VII small subunit [Oscillospiraceae bacterium]|nr:exodeoxyribonuclease VII small subunit [Oscillospiraceae bacterium]